MIWKVFASCLNHFRCKYWIFLLSIKFWEQNWVALAAIISMFNCKCFCYKRRCVESVSIIRKALIKSHIIMEFLKNLSRPFGIIKYSLRYREILPVFSLAFLWIFHGNLQSSFIYFFTVLWLNSSLRRYSFGIPFSFSRIPNSGTNLAKTLKNIQEWKINEYMYIYIHEK